MGMFDGIKNKMIRIAAEKANDKTNFYPQGREANDKMDESALGEKNSDMIQEGLITDSFLEFLAGFHYKSKDWWASRLIEEAQKVKGGTYDQ